MGKEPARRAAAQERQHGVGHRPHLVEVAQHVHAQFFVSGVGRPGGPGGPDGSIDGSGASTSSGSDVSKALCDFLKLLQDSQSALSGYGANGGSLVFQIRLLIVNESA